MPSLFVAISEVDHLPKMDTFGKCDPMVRVVKGGESHKTSHKEKTYKAIWSEEFKFDSSNKEDIVFEVLDHNAVTSATVIGTCKVTAKEWEAIEEDRPPRSFTMKISDKKGKIVKGNDGEETQLTFALRVGNLERASSILALAKKSSVDSTPRTEEASSIALQVRVVALENLPKMDGSLTGGKADPFVVIEFAGQTHETSRKKNTLSAEWQDEVFTFDYKGSSSEMVFTARDYDVGLVGGSSEVIGTYAISHSKISRMALGGVGRVYAEVGKLLNDKGHAVTGHNNKGAEISIEFQVVKPEPKTSKPDAKQTAAAAAAAQQQALAAKAEADKKKAEKEKQALEELVAKQAAELERLKAEIETQKKTLKHEKDTLSKVREELDYSNGVKHAVQRLLPESEPGMYSDLTIECVLNNDVETIPAHLSIMWARSGTAMRAHIHAAYNLQGKKAYVVDVRNDDEMDADFAFLKADEFNLDTPGDKDAAAAAAQEKDGKGKRKDEADSSSVFQEHKWSPAHCISVPGTVFGVGYRCTCAHGAFALTNSGGTGKGGKEEKEGVGGGEGGFVTVFRILGVRPSVLPKVLEIICSGARPSVVRKVVEIIYGYDSPHWTSDEVLDAITLARFFSLNFLLVALYKAGHFSEWGCALWDAARVMDQGLGASWVDRLLHDADEHFAADTFERDGAHTLTRQGMAYVLGHDHINCGEMLVFSAMMLWCKERLKKTERRASVERSKIESKTQELALMPGKDTDAKLGVLRLKREALEKKKPSWQSIARPMAMLVRYPFIAPELLNYSIAENGDFQGIGATDSRGVPILLRAVFHQDGQRGREVDWKETLKWTPRKGSIIYSGEWEWIYGPSSKTPKGNAFEWPIQPKYLDLDFPFATDEEIANLALTKVEVYNLDNDGDGDPSVTDMLITFMNAFPTPLGGGKTKAEGKDGVSLHAAPNLDSLKESALEKMQGQGWGGSKTSFTQAKFLGAVKKLALVQHAFQHPHHLQHAPRNIFAIGRVRPSALRGDGSGSSGRKLRDRADQRLWGRAFAIFSSRSEAYDVKLRFEGQAFWKQVAQGNDVHDVKMKWEELKGETGKLRIEITGDVHETGVYRRGGAVAGVVARSAVKLEVTVVCCLNLPKKDLLGSCDAYVLLKYEGFEFKTDTVKSSLDPQFNQTFVFPVDNRQDPAQLVVMVMDWDRLSKDDLVGSARIPSEALAAILDPAYDGPNSEALELTNKHGKTVIGANKQKALVQIQWRCLD